MLDKSLYVNILLISFRSALVLRHIRNKYRMMKKAIKDNIPKGSYRDYLDSSKYIRVVRLAKTPGYDEFSSSSLRVIIAILLVGFLGFSIFEIMGLIPM